MGDCKLCGEEKKLVKAHVVPEPFWPPSNDGVPKLLSNKVGVYPKRSRIGVYDEGILCGDCDGKLGTLDQHAVENLLHSKNRVPISGGMKAVAFIYQDACPIKVREFITSVVWRASISTHSFYGRVDLGPYEDSIRLALLTGGSLDDNIQAFLGEFDSPHVSFLNPHWTRMSNAKVWVVYAGRFILYLKVDKRSLPSPFDELHFIKGRQVISVDRGFQDSKEAWIIKKIVLANPRAFPSRR